MSVAMLFLGLMLGIMVGMSFEHRTHEIEEEERTKRLERELRDRR